jgi:crossover junction endodeoxyribonuclease RuvC
VIFQDVFRTGSKLDFSHRLNLIYSYIEEILGRYQVDCMAIESIFYGKNVKNLIYMGHSRGVILLAAAKKNLKINEYSPREIKRAVTGTGQASKQQIQYMMKSILGLDSFPKPDHVADALAVAICHSLKCSGSNK